MKLYGLPQKVQVNHPLTVGVKNVLTSVATLRDMMRHINSHHTSETSHGSQKYQKTSRLSPVYPPPVYPRFIRRIADRFTDDMLERYCKALGIKLFDDFFFGMKAAVINTVQKLPAGAPVMSLEGARSHIVALN